MVLNPATCVFGVSELDFLGYRVTAHGIRPLDDKVSAVRNFPQPSTLRGLCEFLGMVNFYHRFIPNSARILQLLNRLQSTAHITWHGTKKPPLPFTRPNRHWLTLLS
jgi:hypothetical protein